jgi:site-specific DNA-methyltransferase (adenine-specific)
MNKNIELLGDCLDLMRDIPDGSIDMILADLPYGTTACSWDLIIPFDKLWDQYKRIIKYNGAIVLTASQPFTTKLINSNMDMFKYCWYWKKTKANGFQHSKNKPMTAIEECCVFSKAPMGHKSLLGERRMVYNPQGIIPSGKKTVKSGIHGNILGSRPKQIGKEYESYTNFPNNVLEYANLFGKNAKHPTQKPVDLFRYLIRTYTEEGDLVLDNVAGSGTTAIACLMENRNYIVMEKDEKCFNDMKERIDEFKNNLQITCV